MSASQNYNRGHQEGFAAGAAAGHLAGWKGQAFDRDAPGGVAIDKIQLDYERGFLTGLRFGFRLGHYEASGKRKP